MNPIAAQEFTAEFRDVMASVCTPVTVVTALDGARPHGTTVSAFASLSLDPPMVLVALDRGSDLLTVVRSGGRFGVNVLGHGQDALALTFARKGTDKFDGVDWSLSAGVPRVDAAPGWLACRVADLVDGGDHVVVLGHVEAAARVDHPPLTYHQRTFGTHSAEQE
ncbi:MULTISPECIES: flavin reductase family protein [Rhodococcus]|uniref:Flavin reductase domain-containing protein n=2 Tax=Rhodococcus TaxID=1827 RepID=M2YXQ9_9NOCA|nr:MULTISPECIES: flavin reductase family protein [Rhodococcus]EME66775.1 flavin reductase domain-containing protein [Rhodococcus ruber BKS 20-38]KOS56956.1 flavin reductase [Rhodococcus rhodochrous KG-21]